MSNHSDDLEQIKYWRVYAASLSQSLREQKKQYEKELTETRTQLRDLQIAYAKEGEELEKELTVTKFQLAYWREIALENQSNV